MTSGGLAPRTNDPNDEREFSLNSFSQFSANFFSIFSFLKLSARDYLGRTARDLALLYRANASESTNTPSGDYIYFQHFLQNSVLSRF